MQCVGSSCRSSSSSWRRPPRRRPLRSGSRTTGSCMPGGPAAARAVAEWSDMGVDTVRIFAHWSRIAPARRPRGFRAEDPNDPNYQWFLLDLAIDRVRAAGMSVTLTVTGPGPAWTSAAPGRRQGQWKPKPAAYGDFAEAVARRYGVARRPLHPLERAEHLDLAVAAGSLQEGPLHAGRAAPLPRARPRRVPGDRRPRPRLRDRDRRAVTARPAPPQREDRDAPAAVPAPARLPHRRAGSA